jgi:diguanylate cyclase (GGDEF)-like protein
MLIKEIAVKESVAIDYLSSMSYAIEVMEQNHCGVVVALDGEKPVGVLTERDLLHHINSDLSEHTRLNSLYTDSVITVNHNRSIEYGLHVLIDNNIRRLIVVDSDQNFVGIVTQESLVNYLDEDTFRVNIKVSNLIGTHVGVITLSQEHTIKEAVDEMNRHNIGAVVIVDEAQEPIGIFTERDIVSVLSENVDPNISITEVMTKSVISVDVNDNLNDVVALMDMKHIRRVLVKDGEKMVSIVGTRDIVQNLKGNYGAFLESKLRGIKKTLNYMGESIIEIYDDHNKHIIQWINDKAVENFSSAILDQEVQSFIEPDIWSQVYQSLKSKGRCDKVKVQIGEQFFEMLCSYHFNNNVETILIVLRDISKFEHAVLDEKQKREKIEKELTLLQDIINQQNNLIAVIAPDGVSIVNQAFYDFYNINTIEEFSENYGCLSSTFISHKDFYSYDSVEHKDLSWIRDIEKLPDTKRVVSIIDINTIEPKAFSVQVNDLQHYEGYYVVTLTDITDIKIESQKHYYHATHDPLTSLYNRGYYLDKLDHAISDAKKYQKPFSIILLDIDHFKSFNDTYGHLKGDEVLITVGSVLQSNTRKDDIVARWGGEEFIVLLLDTPLDTASLIAENLRVNIAKIEIVDIDRHITSSFGVSEFDASKDDENSITNRADTALYKAKAQGRNIVVTL